MVKASGGDSRSEEEIRQEQETLQKLNEDYENAFPGLRYVYVHFLSRA